MCITSENDEKMMPKNGIDSAAADDSESIGGNGRLKKGPWTAAEDAVLVEYVNRKGEGNWNAVQRHTGLARCGKSCRLRWANHLRPDLKKGAFTPEEEHLIIDMHSKIGNKWARMASEMPGRTDNEIKNYWNTRIKRRQRAGLPLYPPGLRLQALNENQQNDNMSSLSSGDGGHSRDVNNFEIPSIQFKNLELNQPAVYPPAFLDIPPSGFLPHGLHSPYPDKSELLTMHPAKRKSELSTMGSAKRIRGSESVLPYQNGCYVQNGQPFTYASAYDHPNIAYTHPLSSSVLAGSHANLNGNPSSSEPTWAMKQELPSLQTQVDNWCSPSSPLPSLESCDNLIHTPPTEHNLSQQLSSQNSCLLDPIYGSRTVNNPKNSSDMLSSHDSSMVFDYASSQLIQEAGWEPYGELTSPLGHSSSSMFSGNSISEPEAVEAITELKKKQSSGLHHNITRVRRQTRSAGQIFCFLRKSHNTLAVDDLSRDWKLMDIRSDPLHMIPLDERPVLKSLLQKRLNKP